MNTSPPTILLAVALEIVSVSTVAFNTVIVLAFIVEFTVSALVAKDASEIPETTIVLADKVLKTALGPITVLTVSVDGTVSPLLVRVLKNPVAPVRLLVVIELPNRVLIKAFPDRRVLVLSVLMAADTALRFAMVSVLVARVLNVPFVPVRVLTSRVLAEPSDV